MINKQNTFIVNLAMLTLLFSGCAKYDILKTGKIEQKNKTMIVPATGILSMMEIKKMLLKNGWKLQASHLGTKTIGQFSENINLLSTNYTKSKYRMYIEETTRMNQFVLTITVSIIDNETQEEVLTLFGDSLGAGGVFTSETAEKLEQALKEIEN